MVTGRWTHRFFKRFQDRKLKLFAFLLGNIQDLVVTLGRKINEFRRDQRMAAPTSHTITTIQIWILAFLSHLG